MSLDERPSRVRRSAPLDADVAALRRVLGPEARDPVPKRHAAGTHRTEAPERTLARLLPRLPEFGITRVARITGFDRAGVEVVTVVRPNARALSVANGKGLSLAAARVSGIMEGIERWHGERPLLPLRFGDPDDIAGLAPHCADLPRVRPWDLGPITWAPALDLATGAATLVPFEAVHTCWLAHPAAETPFHASTNGLASGSHPVEAALHALCELIEHDSCALFDRLPPEARAARRLDPGSIDDAEVAAQLGRLDAAGFAVGIWDATSDIGVPVFLAALLDLRNPRSPAGFGSGCHPDRMVAALRALTEAAQTRAIAITGTRDDLAAELFSPGIGVRFRWALREVEGGSRRAWRAATTLASDDLRTDLAAVRAAVARVGCGPVLAVDLSREPRISVVRVLVPGLETETPGVLSGARAARAAELLA